MDNQGVPLAQLVKASVGQADVQRFEPHLGHNWFKLAISVSDWLSRYTNVHYLQSHLKRRGQLLFLV